jgi:hypothetical protein
MRWLLSVLVIFCLSACEGRKPPQPKARTPVTDGLRVVPTPPPSFDTTPGRR